jgi:outer membrane protein
LIPATLAQELITAENAVNIALKSNYNILVARNNADIAKLNNTPGNAGMLPSAEIKISDNYSLNNAHLQLASDTIINSANEKANIINAAAELNWTLFDGGRMFVTKNKLNEIESLGEIQFRNEIQQTVYNVVLAYYNVVKQKQQLASINKIISYNQERVSILQTGFNSGSSPKNNLLQAKIDLNVYLENAIIQQIVIVAAKRELNQILCRSADSTAYDVIDSIPLNYKPDTADLYKKIYTNNTNILSFLKQVDIARLNVNELKADRLPKISFNAGYNLYYSENPSGTTILNRTYGPQIGGTLTIPIYQAGNISRQIETSKVMVNSAEYDLENSKIEVNIQLKNALSIFDNQQRLLEIEQQNAELVKENLEISMQRLRYGQTTALEVRQAQQSYEDSFTRLINFKYNVKVAETTLKLLIAEL